MSTPYAGQEVGHIFNCKNIYYAVPDTMLGTGNIQEYMNCSYIQRSHFSGGYRHVIRPCSYKQVVQ